MSQINTYDDLCTQMYELLHPQAPAEELDFFLSYAQPGQRILEPMCGSGRFLLPFLDHGFDITGQDRSQQMLDKLWCKAPQAQAALGNLLDYCPAERFDYIFIPCCSMSLFTDRDECLAVLKRLKALLAPGGVLVFSVETLAGRCPDDAGYRETARVTTQAGDELLLESKNHYDSATQTQYMPGIYTLRRQGQVLAQETMDFQTHLYRLGEMEALLAGAGFCQVSTYADFQRRPALDDKCEQFLLECRL